MRNKVPDFDYGIINTPIGTDNSIPDILEERIPKKRRTNNKSSQGDATPEQRRAVEEAQNASRRGRGRKKGKRIPIHFEASKSTVDAINELHFVLGKTKNDLYNEALELLLAHYRVG